MLAALVWCREFSQTGEVFRKPEPLYPKAKARQTATATILADDPGTRSGASSFPLSHSGTAARAADRAATARCLPESIPAGTPLLLAAEFRTGMGRPVPLHGIQERQSCHGGFAGCCSRIGTIGCGDCCGLR